MNAIAIEKTIICLLLFDIYHFYKILHYFTLFSPFIQNQPTYSDKTHPKIVL